MLGISCGKIKENEIKHVEGYMFKTDKLTKNKFEEMREFNTDHRIGNISLDLLNSEGDIIDTLTITQKRFDLNRGCLQ